MEVLFDGHCIIVTRRGNKYYIKYDSGELVSRTLEIEVSEEDAKKAQESEDAAYRVILHYENIAMLGEDYMDRGK